MFRGVRACGPAFRLGLIGIAVLWPARAGLAGGFIINELSASAAGTAVAGAAAVGEDAGTVFYNPAAMSLLDRDQLMIVGQVFALDTNFENEGTVDGTGGIIIGSDDAKDQILALPSLFAVYGLSDRVKIGLAVTSPFGLSSEYENDWVGRYNTRRSAITTVDINPAVSVRLTDWLSIGGGISAQYALGERLNDLDFGTVCFTEFFGPAGCAGLGILPQGADGRLEVEADDWAFGYNLGALVELQPRTRIGLAYRSQVHHSLSGDAKYDVPAVAAPLTLGGVLFQDTDARAEITMPATLTLSLYHEIAPRLAFLGDITWSGWHSFETLRIEFANPVQPDIVQEEDWRDVFRYSAGLRYQATEDLVARVGVAYDESPVQNSLRNPGIPVNDRLVFGVGGGYRLSDSLVLDVAYVYAHELDASVEPFRPESGTVRGEYHNRVHILSGQLSWRF